MGVVDDIKEIKSLKFYVSWPQRILFGILAINLIIVSISSRDASRSALQQSQVLTSVETPATSIIFTQRETLVYATKLALWSSGSITRREVQIARALLAQRLQVIDSTGKSVGENSTEEFREAITKSDDLLVGTNPGILSPSLQASIKSKMAPVLNELVFQARELVFTYQNAVDSATKQVAASNGKKDSRTLRLIDLFVSLFVIFWLWVGFANVRRYRLFKEEMEAEQERLKRMNEELDVAKSTVLELKSLNEQKNAFISTVNHELRTPMTSIIGYTEVIREQLQEPPNPEINKHLKVISRNADIMLNLIESMLSISRLESHSELSDKQIVNINEVIADSIFVLQPNLERAKIGINFEDLDKQSHLLDGNSSQISQILINLIANAIKFSPAHTTISVRAKNYRTDDGVEGVEIQVEDQGIGIPEADQERVFQRFFRAKNAVTQQYAGTGLGLSIVGRVIELHNGTISLQSREGQGTLFVVRLPKSMNDTTPDNS